MKKRGNKQGDFSKIKEFYKIVMPHFWRRGLFISILLILSTVILLPTPFLSKYLIDTVIPEGKFSILLFILGGLLFITILSSLFGIFLTKIQTKLSQDISIFLRNKIAKKLETVDDSFFMENDHGVLLNRFVNDVGSAQGVLFDALTSLIMNVFTLIFGLAAMLYLDYRLTIILLFVLPFYIVSTKVMEKPIRKISEDLIKSRQRFFFTIDEFAKSIHLIKAYVIEKFENRRFDASMEDLKKKIVKSSVIHAFSSSLIGFISSLGPILVLCVGGYFIMKGEFTLGGLIAFTSFIGYLFDPAASLASLKLMISSVTPHVDVLLKLYDYPDEEPKDVKHETINSGNIEFRNVSVKIKGKEILKNVSFDIKNKQMVSFVGESGAGKSSVIKVLMGFWHPSKGKIIINGKNLSEININGVRKSISEVSQTPILLKDTILTNIKLGKKLDLEKVRDAAKIAEIDSFIMKLDKNYKTIINPDSENFSGGQLQRITLTRAIAHDTKIMVLDEFTSALDPETEEKILSLTKKLKGKKTIISVAHHLSCIKDSDVIFVMKQGRIAERGSFNQLRRNKKSLFNKIFREEI